MKEQRKRLNEYQPVSQLLEVTSLYLKLPGDNSKLFLIFQSYYYTNTSGLPPIITSHIIKCHGSAQLISL